MKIFEKICGAQIFAPKSPQWKSYIGDPDLLEIFERALESEDNVNVMMVGPPACGKTIIMEEIEQFYKDKALYLVGATLTNRLLDKMNENKETLRYLCIDELEKMWKNYQEELLTFFESGRVIVEKQSKRYNIQVKGVKTFAGCNSIQKFSPAFLSRWIVLYLPEYTYEQFEEIAVKKLPKMGKIAPYIAKTVWNSGSKNIRDVLEIGKLAKQKDTPEDIDRLLNTIHNKFGAPKK